jgi:hypothetical protein
MIKERLLWLVVFFVVALLSNMRVGEAESRRTGAVVVEGN